MCGLNNTRQHLRVSGGCVRPLRSIYICFASALRPLYTLPLTEEACFVLNLPAILNLIWPGHPPFIGACERRLPMNIQLHVHYAMHVLPYSGKVWWGESLANLAKLAKLQVIRQIKPSKLSIQNSSVAISARRQCEYSIFAKLSFAKTSRCPIRQTFPPPNFPAIRYILNLIV